MDKIKKLTLQEEQVMLCVWECGTCNVRDIVSRLPKPSPPYTTVASIMTNLKRKGYLALGRSGNTYEYTPLIAENEYKSEFMGGFIQDYFENSYKEMVSFFAKEQKISADELKEIIRLIEKGES